MHTKFFFWQRCAALRQPLLHPNISMEERQRREGAVRGEHDIRCWTCR